jgi:hypothetical protein
MISFGGRSTEGVKTQFGDVTLLVDTATGEEYFKIRYKRLKIRGKDSDVDNFSMVCGKLEVEILKLYISVFPESLR